MVACTELVCHAGRLKHGAPFPTDGLTPLDLFQLWQANQIDNATEAPAKPGKPPKPQRSQPAAR